MDSSASTAMNTTSYYSWRAISIILLLSNTLILSILYLNSATTTATSPPFALPCHQNEDNPPPGPTDELEAVLERASGDDKTVIIAVVNRAYVEEQGGVVPNMLDLFLEGFWQGEHTRELLDRLVIVAVDHMAYERCRFRGLHCYRLSTDGQDFMGEEIYMSRGFINMMWRRTRFLIQVLKKGYSFIFTDTDVLWLRNPFPILSANYKNSDMQFSTDFYNGNSSSTKNAVNTGFYFVRSNNKTISLFERWYGLKDKNPRTKEQDVIQKMVWQGVFGELKIKVKFLETRLFSGFCQKMFDAPNIITIHANCCRFIRAKVVDLNKLLHMWVQYRAAPPNGTASFRWSQHVECKKSWQKKLKHP